MTTAIARRKGPEVAAQVEESAPARVQIAVAVSPTYKDWAEKLAASLRMPVYLTVDHALAALAASKGYPAPPPRRS